MPRFPPAPGPEQHGLWRDPQFRAVLGWPDGATPLPRCARNVTTSLRTCAHRRPGRYETAEPEHPRVIQQIRSPDGSVALNSLPPGRKTSVGGTRAGRSPAVPVAAPPPHGRFEHLRDEHVVGRPGVGDGPAVEEDELVAVAPADNQGTREVWEGGPRRLWPASRRRSNSGTATASPDGTGSV